MALAACDGAAAALEAVPRRRHEIFLACGEAEDERVGYRWNNSKLYLTKSIMNSQLQLTVYITGG